MAISRIKASSILQGFPKSRSVLAGNTPFPSTPTIGTASDGGTGTTVSVAFTPGTYVGTSYTVISTPGSFTATGASSPLTVSGLTTGTSYTFKVYATNSVGNSPQSAASNSVAPAVPKTPTVEYLVIAGGGAGGGGGKAGGGGGGQMVNASGYSVSAGTAYTVTVGGSGSNSVFATITGNKGNNGGGTGGNGGSSGNGYAGGSGGTYGDYWSVGYLDYAGGGGGGAGGAGGNSSGYYDWYGVYTYGGNGGAGASNAITGSSVTYAGGGGGQGVNANGSGGSGGGGAGGSAGAANTGGGGGGGASGGSGLVVIRYSDSYAAATSTTGSPSFTVAGGYKIYKFTGSGSITF